MATDVTNLKRLLTLCGDRQVFILTPLLIYAHLACCKAISHSIHGLILDFAVKSSEDLRRLNSFIASPLSAFLNSKVIHSLRWPSFWQVWGGPCLVDTHLTVAYMTAASSSDSNSSQSSSGKRPLSNSGKQLLNSSPQLLPPQPPSRKPTLPGLLCLYRWQD